MSEAELRDAVQARLRGQVTLRPGPPPDQGLALAGSVARAADARWIATLALYHGDALAGSREIPLEEESCRALDEALVLVISMMVQQQVTEPILEAPEAQLRPAPDSPPAPSRSDVPDEHAPLSPAEVVAREPRPLVGTSTEPPVGERSRMTVSAGAALTLGLMPTVAAGAEASVGVMSSRRFAFEVQGTLIPRGEAKYQAGRAEIIVGYAGLRLCPTVLQGTFALDVCVSSIVGAMRVSARGIAPEEFTRRKLLLGASAGLRGTWYMRHRVFVRTSVLAAALFKRDRFVVASSDHNVTLHRVAPLVGLMSVEVGLRCP